MKDNNIRAVCFDIDGTLYPKWQADLILFKTSLLHLPFAIRYMKMRIRIREMDGYDDFPLSSGDEFKEREYRIMYPEGHKDIAWFKKKEKKVFHDKWEKAFSRVKGFRGMSEFLKELSSSVSVAFLSDFPIGSKLRALDIEGVASCVLSSEEAGRLKPSRLPFRLLCEHLGLEAEEVLYVGDSEKKDVKGAHQAGMRSLLITQNRKKAQSSSADIVVSSFYEMREKLL